MSYFHLHHVFRVLLLDREAADVEGLGETLTQVVRPIQERGSRQDDREVQDY